MVALNQVTWRPCAKPRKVFGGGTSFLSHPNNHVELLPTFQRLPHPPSPPPPPRPLLVNLDNRGHQIISCSLVATLSRTQGLRDGDRGLRTPLIHSHLTHLSSPPTRCTKSSRSSISQGCSMLARHSTLDSLSSRRTKSTHIVKAFTSAICRRSKPISGISGL